MSAQADAATALIASPSSVVARRTLQFGSTARCYRHFASGLPRWLGPLSSSTHDRAVALGTHPADADRLVSAARPLTHYVEGADVGTARHMDDAILERMSVRRLPPERAAEAVDVLLEVFPDFPGSSALAAAGERRIARLLHERTVESGLAIGRVDVGGSAGWRRGLVPATGPRGAGAARTPRPSLRNILPAEVVEPPIRA